MDEWQIRHNLQKTTWMDEQQIGHNLQKTTWIDEWQIRHNLQKNDERNSSFKASWLTCWTVDLVARVQLLDLDTVV